MIKFVLKIRLLGIMGAALMGCSDGAAKSETSDASKVSEPIATFVGEYLVSRFNGSNVSSLGTPRKGFRIPVKMGESGLEVVGLKKPKVVTTPEYVVYPTGGPYEFPNVILADRATPIGFESLQALPVGVYNRTFSEWIIGKDAAFDFGTFIDGSLEKGADVCPSSSEAFTAKIEFSNKMDNVKKSADIAICVSDVMVQGGVSSKKMPYVQTVITGIE